MRSKEKRAMGGTKKGSLTKNKIKKLQVYFGEAIKGGKNAEEMKKNIFATLKHCGSTDKHHKHEDCGDWCFYKKALAKGEKPGPHSVHLTTYLRQEVIDAIMPSYIRMSQHSLLQRCEGYLTQNCNESLHHCLWKDMTKNKMYGKDRVKYGAARAVTKFNLGAAAAEVEGTGEEGRKITKKMDARRKLRMDVIHATKELKKERKRKRIAEEQRKIREEGVTYEAGGWE